MIAEDGKITASKPGRTAIRVRFLRSVASVDVRIGYEGLAAPSAFRSQNVIDEIVAQTWREVGLTPVGQAADHVFLRRASVRAFTSPTVSSA